MLKIDESKFKFSKDTAKEIQFHVRLPSYRLNEYKRIGLFSTPIDVDDIYRNGISFYNLKNETQLINGLRGPKDSVSKWIPKGECVLCFDYPLSTNINLYFDKIKTRKDLALAVFWGYKNIYWRNDSRTLKMPSNCITDLKQYSPSEIGIWGHDITDLIVHSVTVSKKKIIPGVPTFNLPVSS